MRDIVLPLILVLLLFGPDLRAWKLPKAKDTVKPIIVTVVIFG
jgi:hypothetical protein